VAGLTAALGVYSFVGASGVYALARALNAGRYAWLAVGLWLLTPFRAFELFSSGLMSSFAGGGVAAWVLVTLHRLEVAPPSGKARALSFFALAYGALALTNLPYAVMAAYMVAAWVAVRSASRAEPSGSLRMVGAGALGAAVASVYVLPMLVHRPEMYVPQTTPFEWWRINFLFDSEAHLSPRLRMTLENAALLPAAGLVLSLVVLGVLRRSGRVDEIPASRGVRLLATFGLVALVLTTPLTAVLWATLPVLKEVQFPWRLLEVVAVPCAVLMAVAMRLAVASTLEARSAPSRASDLAVVVLAGGLVVVGVLTALSFRSISRMTARAEAFHSGALSGADLARTFHGRMAFFMPMTAADPTTLPEQPLVLPLTPRCDVSVERWGQAERVFTVQSDGPCDVALRTFDFPGWRAERVTERGTDPLEVSADPDGGRLLVSVPEGEAQIRVWFASGWPTTRGRCSASWRWRSAPCCFAAPPARLEPWLSHDICLSRDLEPSGRNRSACVRCRAVLQRGGEPPRAAPPGGCRARRAPRRPS